MKKYAPLLFCLLTPFFTNSQTAQQIEYLKAFAKACGYVHYFHPSDEAAELSWNRFAIYGAQEIERCNSQEEVIATLQKLFEPIAPSIKFSNLQNKKPYDLTSITPKKIKDFQTTYWQHKGVSLGMYNQNGPYKSIRVNRTVRTEKSDGFGNIMSSLDANMYRGKKIKYKAWVKMAKGSSGTGHLWFRVDKVDNTPGFFDNMGARPIIKADWHSYEIVGSVDQLATKLAFGCFLQGKGKLFIDQVQLFYEEDDQWIEIPIKNHNFEAASLNRTGKANQWICRGKGYEFEALKTEKKEGEKAAMIHFIGVGKTEKGQPIFDFEPQFGEIIEKEIGNGIFCQIPLVLYCNKDNTFPKADPILLDQLNTKIRDTEMSPTYLPFRLGNIVTVYNVFQHFYPYFDVVKVDWEAALERALSRCYTDNSSKDHLVTLERLTALLRDGHIWVSGPDIEAFAPPIEWEWIEDQLVITKVAENESGLSVGDIVTHINDQPTKIFFAEIHARISSPTKGWQQHRAKALSLLGPENSVLTLTVNNKELKLNRSLNYFRNRRSQSVTKEKHRLIEEGIHYLNLDIIPMEEIKTLLPQLEKSKAIICDLRGYPKSNHGIISHLLSIDDTTSAWMQVPHFVYPDQEKLIGYQKIGWMMKKEKPYLGDKKIIFIIDGRAISYAESFMGFIEGYKLATIIGQPTAGTNGNINPFELPGGFRLSWTGMKVVKHNGSQHHGIGVLPNIYIHKTIKGIKEGRDEFLEKAIEIAKGD